MDIFKMAHAGVCLLIVLVAVTNLLRGIRKGVIGFYGQGFDRKAMPVSFAALFIAYVVIVVAAGCWAYLDVAEILRGHLR